MALSVTLDTTDASYAELIGNSGGGTAVRSGFVDGLPTDTTVMTPEMVLYACTTAPGMPVMNSLHPANPNIFLNRIRVDSMPNQSMRASVKLYYEGYQGIGSSYILETGGSPSMVETNHVPGTVYALRCSYNAPSSSSSAEKHILEDFVSVSVYRPIAHIRVTQLIFGSLSPIEADIFADNLCCVNDGAWLGRPTGTWLVTDATAVVSVYSGYYTRRVEATRRKGQIWREYGVLRSSITGALAGAGGSDLQDELNALRDIGYSHGAVFKNGCLSLDAYEQIDFNLLFGFQS